MYLIQIFFKVGLFDESLILEINFLGGLFSRGPLFHISQQFYELILFVMVILLEKRKQTKILHLDHLQEFSLIMMYMMNYCLSHNCVSRKSSDLGIGFFFTQVSAKALWSSSSRHKERTSHHPPVHRWATTTEQPCGVAIHWTCHAFSMCYLHLEFCILYFFSAKKSAERVEHFLGSGVKIWWAQKVGEL